jgi:phage repressor protein C with HTH and peptisase S24 domain
MEKNRNPHDYFLEALKYETKLKWRGKKKLLASQSGISVPFLSQILHGIKNAGTETQGQLSNVLGYSYEEFIALGRSLIKTGQPPPQKAAEQPPPIEHNLIVQVNSQSDKDSLNGISEFYRGIPLYESGRLAAGVNGLVFDPYEEPASTVIVYKPELQGHSKHNLRALRVGGDSMKPNIVKGAIVVVDLDDKEFADRKIFVIRTQDMIAAVKRVRKWEKGFVLVSDNPDFLPEPTELDWNELCVGRVIWQWKDMREG